MWKHFVDESYTECGRKMSPLGLFIDFQEMAWNFKIKIYTFI